MTAAAGVLMLSFGLQDYIHIVRNIVRLTWAGILSRICSVRSPTYREAESPMPGWSSLLTACSKDCKLS